MKTLLLTLTLLAALALPAQAFADAAEAVAELQHDWAEANYELEGEEQEHAFAALLLRSESYRDAHPDAAEVWIWDGIIRSTYAGVAGGLGALKLAKQSRKSLEHALELDADALHGSAYTSLGALYYKVPGWPVGFGSDKKAEKYLQRALELNPDGIDSNYFYADYLRDEKRYEDAERYFLKAQNAPPRPDRPLADAGRQQEIAAALTELHRKDR